MVNIADPCSSVMGEFNDGWSSCEGSNGLGTRVLKSGGGEGGNCWLTGIGATVDNHAPRAEVLTVSVGFRYLPASTVCSFRVFKGEIWGDFFAVSFLVTSWI